MGILRQTFFGRDTPTVAADLLGNILVVRRSQSETQVLICETEAYGGSDDPASHAYKGVTPRARVMFGRPGRAYVYFVYGMHHCFNIVTESEGVAGAVLIRGGVVIRDSRWIQGPGRLCAALGLNLAQNGCDLTRSDGEVTVRRGGFWWVKDAIVAGPRVGISRAKDRPWRFFFEPQRLNAELRHNRIKPLLG